MTRTTRLVGLCRALAAIVRDQQLTFLAAAIAYYAFVSVIPLLLVTLAVGTALAGQTVANRLLDLVGQFLTPQAETLLEGALVGGTGRGGATVVGLGVLLWSSLRVFRGLDVAFSRIYGSDAPLSLFEQVRDALLVVTAIAVALGSTVVLGTVLPLSNVPFAELFGPLGLVIVLAVVFLPLYYVFPDRRIRVREAVPGAVFAGVGWTLLGVGFGIYADQATTFQLYGIIGAVLLVLTWFYFGGLLVLLGAALNAVLAGQRDRQLQQGPARTDNQRMSESEGSSDEDDTADVSTVESESVDYADLAELRRELDRFEEEIEDRTVHREDLESDLKQYVRSRVRRGHAHGWGPYLVLLYGTAMTIGGFYFLNGVWAILAMLVIWLSTLGLYALMVIVGITVTAVGLPGRILDRVRNFR